MSRRRTLSFTPEVSRILDALEERTVSAVVEGILRQHFGLKARLTPQSVQAALDAAFSDSVKSGRNHK